MIFRGSGVFWDSLNGSLVYDGSGTGTKYSVCLKLNLFVTQFANLR